MSVQVGRVIVNNFKSCVLTDISLSKYTALIGYNNSGKSNIISAIHWLLRKSVLDSSSFKDPAQPIEVEGHIDGISAAILGLMPQQQRQQIQQYVVNEKLVIKRTQTRPDVKVADIKLSVWSEQTYSWVPNPTGIDNAIGVLLPEPIRIGAMEDAAEDSSKAKTSTTIGKLLAEFIEPVRTAHEAELDLHLDEVERRISADGDARLTELDIIDASLSSKINDLFPGLSIKLHFPVPELVDLIKSGTVKVYEDAGPSRMFSSYGHGAQRSIQMALIRHLAEVRRAAAVQHGTTLLLIDEPELYLHPFAVEHIREALKSLSNNGYQVILSTHSAQMVTAKDAENALLIRKSTALGTHSRRRLRDAIQNVVPNATHQTEQLFTLGNSSQVLFADKVILTEGKTELRLLPCIFHKELGRTLGQNRVALIAQSGVCDTKKSMEILIAMDIPSKAIVDLDYALNGGISHGFVAASDQNVAAIKAIFTRLETAGQITLNTNTGLPQNGIVTAATAFALMAAEPDALQPIEALHIHLKAQNIWLWKKGTIENHLGLTAKNETAWAGFQTDYETLGLQAMCPEHQTISEMIAWVAM